MSSILEANLPVNNISISQKDANIPLYSTLGRKTAYLVVCADKLRVRKNDTIYTGIQLNREIEKWKK